MVSTCSKCYLLKFPSLLLHPICHTQWLYYTCSLCDQNNMITFWNIIIKRKARFFPKDICWEKIITFYVSRYLLKMANYYSVYTFSNCIKYFWNTLFFVSYPEEKKYVRPVHLIQLNDFFLLDNHYSLKHGLLYQLYFMCCHRFNNTSSLMHRVRNFHIYTFQKYNKF